MDNSTLVDNASLLMIPSGVKEGKLYSILPQNGLGDFTVSRNSTATYVDKDGLVKVAEPNVPRIDWSTGEPMLLVEGESTNLAHYSDMTDWGNHAGHSTSEISDILSPYGTPFIKYTTGDDSNSNNFQKIAIISGGAKAVNYSISFFLKVGSTPERIQIRWGGTTTPYHGFYIHTDNLVSSDEITILALDNDVYKVSFTTGVFTEGSTFNTYIGLDQGDAGRYIYVTDFQLEEGSKATSYIPTNGSIATRLAESIYNNNAQDLIGQSEGTVFIDIFLTYQDTGTTYVGMITLYSSTSNRIGIWRDNADSNEIRFRLNSIDTDIVSDHGFTEGRHKIALSYKEGEYGKGYIDGVEVLNQPIGQFSELPNIILGREIGGGYPNDSIKDLKLYKTALSEEQLIALTTL